MMSNERLFLDTVFIQALLNKQDQYYRPATAFLPRVKFVIILEMVQLPPSPPEIQGGKN